MLRHGITEGNKNRWFYGELDIPLLPEGIEQLARQKEQGFYPEPPACTRFYTTGLIRTEETLVTLFGEREFGVISDLQEMKFGKFEGTTFDEVKDEEAFTSWTHDESGDVEFPGGESRNQFAERVRRGIETLLENHRELEESMMAREPEDREDVLTVLICHGGVIAGMMNELFPGVRKDMWAWMIEPGCGYIIDMDGSKPVSNCQIGELNVYYGKVLDPDGRV